MATIQAMMAALGEELRGLNTSEGKARGLRPLDPHPKEASPARYVITGTGTGIGKTVFAAALTAALEGDYWKPVQAGLEPETDTERVQILSGLPDDHFHPETYRLATPAAPLHAALDEGITIDPERLIPPLTSRPLIIEGAGGLMVPLTPHVLMIDLFAQWNLPVVLVASTALGTINHTLLSIEAMRARGISIHGIAFVGAANERTESDIITRSGVRRLGRLPLIDPLTPDGLARSFSANFDSADFLPAPAAGSRP